MGDRKVLVTVVLTLLLALPLIPGVPYDVLNTAVLACEYAIAALSIVLLIGLVGQISLGQAALIGMGGFTGAIATQRFGVHFPATLIVGIAAGTITAVAIGTVALRVRGLYLAVATLIFAYVCDQYLFKQPWLVENLSGVSIKYETIGRPGTLPYFDLSDAHIFYYVALAVATLCLYLVANLRDSRIGRAFAAIRGSEIAAASLGVDVVRYKLVGFALAGALAGLGGALTLVGQRNIAPEQFNFANSLYFLSIAVVGGLRSIGGAVASALLFAIMVGELFVRQPQLGNYRSLVAATLLILVLLFFEGGLSALPERFTLAGNRLGQRFGPVWQATGSRLRPLLQPLAGGSRVRTAVAAAGAGMGRASAVPGEAARTASAGPLSRVIAQLPGGLRRRLSPSTGGRDVVDVTGLMAASAPAPVRAPIAPVPDGVAAPIAPQEEVAVQQISRAEAIRRQGRVAGTAGADGRREPKLLQAKNVTVRFGGLTAVDNASLEVGAGEIVGLIGPNGAGKTTMFNSILGLNQPTSGRVDLFGKDVTSWGVHSRAALGVGRTFQILQLFGDLTVFENLMVATHLQNPTGVWGGLVASGRARQAEDKARERVWSVLELMELETYADRKVAGLPFGVLRLIEVARTLVAGARLVCFDEPASGLDSTETERLIEWFRLLRDIGVTLLVIEHDVSMVVRLCDHIYVLDQGKMIFAGTPSEVQANPAVIASYLGTAAGAAA